MKHTITMALLIFLSLVNANIIFCQENHKLIESLKSRYKYRYYEPGVKYLEDIDCYSICKATANINQNVYGLCDNEGKELIPPKYDLIYTFYLKDYSFCEVKSGEKLGIYNIKEGREVVPPIFDEIILDRKESYKGEISEYPKFYVKRNNKWGLYCSLMGELIPTKYDSIKHDKTFECKVSYGDKWTIFDLISKKEIFPIKYDNMERLNNYPKIAKYEADGKYGLLSIEKQQELTNPKYDYISAIGNENFIECVCNEKRCLLDSVGNEIIPPKYSYISIVGDSVAIVIDGITFDDKHNIIRNGKWGAYNLRNGEMIVAPKYDFISREITENILKCNIGGNLTDMAAINGGLWGCIDFVGNEIVPFDYERIGRFEKGVAQVKINGAIGLIENPLSGTTLQFGIYKNSPVDVNIPMNGKLNNETFALIISNENYQKFDASYSKRDGETMAKYCEKRLGIPKKNITLYNDATYGVMQSMLSHCFDIAEVYEGEASFVIYFSGIGFMESREKDCYILPVDVSMTNIKSTSLSITELLSYFRRLNVKYLILITDCPYNGVDRAGNSIVEDRGIAIRQDFPMPDGEITWISTSHTSRKKSIDKDTQHGILTYSILDILQKEQSIALPDLIDKAIKNVKEKAFAINGEISTPVTINNGNKRNLKI